MANVIIAGCGYLGNKLGEILLTEGHKVYGARRDLSKLSPGILPLQCDFTRPSTLDSLPFVQYVIYLVSADCFDESSYLAAYAEGPLNLVNALQKQQQIIEKLILVSSTSVYGQTNGEWVNENSAVSDRHFSQKTILLGESIVLDSQLPATVVRFGGIYGPGRTRMIDLVKNLTVKIETVNTSSEELYLNHIHRDDCAGILRHLIQLNNTEKIYIGVDCDPVKKNTVIKWLAERMKIDPFPSSSAIRSNSPQQSSPNPRRPGSNKRCSNNRLLETNYKFTYPSFREGYDALIGNSL